MAPDTQLLEAIGTLRRHWRRRLLLESAVAVAIAAAIAVVAGLVLIALFGPGQGTVGRGLAAGRQQQRRTESQAHRNPHREAP